MTVMQATFGELLVVQFMHAICCFDSGSQQSNASNSARFGVEMKELQPLEAEHSKLKAQLRNQPWAAKMLSFCCEILQPSYCGISPEASQYLRPTF